MKKLHYIILVILMVFSFVSCKSGSLDNEKVEVKEGSQSKIESTNEAKPKVNFIKDEGYYLKMLNDIEKNLSDLDYLYSDGVTANMRKAESEKYKKWDDALNEIYEVLKKQLSKTEMEKLKKEQLDWIKYRDNSAEKSAAEFKGGTLEGLQYISTSAELTKERCYELVKDYIK